MTTIAIAGAKGGCGKTTTTLGLAEAVGRSGTPAIAVDADRQLPNVHVMAGVERTPTLEAVVNASEVDAAETESIQRSPRIPDTGIIAAPIAADRVDIEAALERLGQGSRPVFVDCPSGAGPDVVEPMSTADGVVVVTTDTERSLAAAETTIDIARRLEVAVLGVVCTRCESVPSTLSSRLGVDVLGTVADVESPLSDDDACDAFDDIARRLEERGLLQTRRERDGNRLETGIASLDRALEGGVPPGSVVALRGPAASQLDHYVARLTVPRGTLYLSTDRSVATVTRGLERTTVATGTPTIRYLEGDTAEERLEAALALVEKLPAGATLVVETADGLEPADREAYLEFLSTVATKIADTDGLAVFVCLTEGQRVANRRYLEQVADLVVDLEVRSTSDTGTAVSGGESTDDHESMRPGLSIPKCRFDESLPGRLEEAAGE